ncbi:hypothetical protein BH11ACT3_BH11ACT3_14100 [soil metagenome]
MLSLLPALLTLIVVFLPPLVINSSGGYAGTPVVALQSLGLLARIGPIALILLLVIAIIATVRARKATRGGVAGRGYVVAAIVVMSLLGAVLLFAAF